MRTIGQSNHPHERRLTRGNHLKATISVSTDASPVLVKDDSKNRFTMRIDLRDFSLGLNFDAAQVRALGLLCLHHFPELHPQYVPSEEEAYRLPAKKIGQLDDRAVQRLLAEVSRSDLVDFIWYMLSPELGTLLTENMSRGAAEGLLDELQRKHGDHHPDRVSKKYIQSARAATLRIVSTLERLQDSGEIEI